MTDGGRVGAFPRLYKTRVQRSEPRFGEEDGLADMEFASLPRKRNGACPSDVGGDSPRRGGVTFPRGKVTKGRSRGIPVFPLDKPLETAKRGLRPPLWNTPGGCGGGVRPAGDFWGKFIFCFWGTFAFFGRLRFKYDYGGLL